jgi:hypothetical protein
MPRRNKDGEVKGGQKAEKTCSLEVRYTLQNSLDIRTYHFCVKENESKILLRLGDDITSSMVCLV